ncbi:hypothetical protein VNO80_06671 [Phaseolus coccineus]|uniref:Uncharacterized protein n=1 Tax=Phaseolus coccineus TaxID=3886 RepID=A0AAN9NIE3_PHACN
MVSTRSMASEKMPEVDQTTMLMALQKELVKMRRKHEETAMKNEEEIMTFRKENEEIKKLVEEGPFIGPINLVGRSFTTTVGPKTAQDPKDKVLTLKTDGESHPNKFLNMTGLRDPVADTQYHHSQDFSLQRGVSDCAKEKESWGREKTCS